MDKVKNTVFVRIFLIVKRNHRKKLVKYSLEGDYILPIHRSEFILKT